MKIMAETVVISITANRKWEETVLVTVKLGMIIKIMSIIITRTQL